MNESGNNVLIIDDDSRNIFALNLVLRSKGYNCLSATSASDGLKILSDNKNISVVLMDMMMPEMDGYEAIAKMRYDKELSKVPVIAVTAQAMTGDKEKCLNAGAAAYISKPVNVDVLVDLLKKYIN